METGTVSTKGQIVIPAPLRRRLGIRKGTIVGFIEQEGRLVLLPVTPEFIRRLRGSLTGTPSPLRTLLEERRKEKNR